eukprot:SAG31_NODE_3504_length_4188_cov_2.084862_3_plen_95_part_00
MLHCEFPTMIGKSWELVHELMSPSCRSQDAMRSGIYWAGEPVTVDSSLQEGTWNASTSTYKRLQQKPKHVEMLVRRLPHPFPFVASHQLHYDEL